MVRWCGAGVGDARDWAARLLAVLMAPAARLLAGLMPLVAALVFAVGSAGADTLAMPPGAGEVAPHLFHGDLPPDVLAPGDLPSGDLPPGDLPPGQDVPYLPPGLRPPGWEQRYLAALRSAPPATRAPDAASPVAPPNLPDIQVAWISREPLYPAYDVEYVDGWTPTLRPGTENARHWPAPGETITYSAHIANRGLQPSGYFVYRWLVDGAEAARGAVAGLAPGEWLTLTFSTQWQQARSWVSFEADVGDAIAEVSDQNNSLSVASDALYQDIRVHPYVYEAFTHYQNARGTYNFEDWLQTHYAQMNERFAQAVYPLSPQGILDRVRVNTVRVTTDVQRGLPNHDGGWQFAVEADDPDTPEDESRQSAENYAREYAQRIDWGLIHELTHQLGFIDLYQVGVEADRVTLPGNDGLPLLMAYACRNCDIMSGGDTAPYNDPTYYSSYSAAAINRNYGQRRGYYGEFLFDIPETNVLVLRDNRGEPLPGAHVQIFQTFENSLPATPVITGVSDGNGVFILPNRPISVEVTTATDHTLRPNPFGRINVVGVNAQLLVKVSRGEHEDYTWRQILDFNMAFWSGLTQTYTITWQTHLPPLDAPTPPPSLSGRFEQGLATLSWPAHPAAAAYRVYASDEPYDRWLSVAVTSTTTIVLQPRWHTRYAVTVVDSAGRESGFSPIYRCFYWVQPNAAVYERSPANWLVLDGHSGAIVQMLDDGRVVGNRVSPHWSFVGGQAFSRNNDGTLAIVQEGRATVINSAWRHLGMIGSAEKEPPRLEQATGVLLAGEPFSTTVRPERDGDTLFLAHFDGDLASGASLPLTATVAFVDGLSGQAVRLGDGSRLAYNGQDHLVQQEGGLDFWVRPEWESAAAQAHVLFSAGDGESYILEVGVVQGWLYAWLSKFDGYNAVSLWTSVGDWQAGQWHHVGVAWQPRWLKLYVDGVLADATTLRRPITGAAGIISVGAAVDGSSVAHASIDELRISGIARVGNSDRVRLLVSEESNGRIKVLDLMGNAQAVWSDSRVARPRGLAALPGGLVAVGDTGDGAIKLLAYDGGAALAYHGLFVAGPGRPLNLTSAGDRLLAPDAERKTVTIYALDARPLAVYSMPNDGYSGAFGGPTGAALSPAGDLLVTDRGKQRVVFVRRGMFSQRLVLPIILRP